MTTRDAELRDTCAISIPDIAKMLPGPWQPHDLATVNNTILRLARLDGTFPWHHHDEDELFLCWDGSVRLESEGREPVLLKPGELYVVPRGTRHRPVTDEVAHVVLIERPETKQYGNV